MDATLTRLLTDKTDPAHSRIETGPLSPPAEGEALLAIRRLALTTNNITYAAFGDAMRYWDFFPTGVDGWGQIPAWGFADVVASTVAGIDVGERIYGYFPIASHLRVQPVRVGERGFLDGSAHRAELASAYNQYSRCRADPSYAEADEDLVALLRPLYITAFFLADFLQDNAAFGAKRLLVSSASSKTAYGSARGLHGQAGLQLVGLTSARHRGFVDGLGCYDRVLAYDELETALAPDAPTLYLDFSGDAALRARVHRHLGAALVYDCHVGSAQTTAFVADAALPGPKPKFYFAPAQIRKRHAEWGPAVATQRYGQAEREFFAQVRRADWLRVVEERGFEAAQRVIAGLAAGRVDPRLGQVVLL